MVGLSADSVTEIISKERWMWVSCEWSSEDYSVLFRIHNWNRSKDVHLKLNSFVLFDDHLRQTGEKNLRPDADNNPELPPLPKLLLAHSLMRPNN